jgi:NADH-quinone oxidoreductase subunit M
VMGPVQNTGYNDLRDAAWNEKMASALLVIGIVLIGIAPFWLTKLIGPGTAIIIEHSIKTISQK